MPADRRRFRPKWWAVLLAVFFVATTIRLGNWQGERAQYKLSRQAQLDAALAAAPLPMKDLLGSTTVGSDLRYRKVSVTGTFADDALFFVDNRIHDGKAGYVALQLFRMQTSGDAAIRHVLVDRGWVAAPAERQNLPALSTPAGPLAIEARINLPPSRNPGTFDNASGPRINYVNIDELAQRLNVKLEPYLLELTSGAGFTGVGTMPPGANFGKNRAYQGQWYAFAALAVVLFVVLSFRKQESS